jgi:putative ATPase
MRPQELDDVIGQDHILGKDKLLRRAIEADRISSIILYGPPGCGKTTLAEVIARATHRRFERTSGVLANVATLRRLLEAATHRKKMSAQETILFIDEIHRFNKAQQDVLLPYVENGDIILIGATTHNPFFFINTPLNSRSQIFQLQPLDAASVIAVLERALAAPEGLNGLVTASADGLAHLAEVCEGDARRALNALEIAALTTPPQEDGLVHLTRHEIEESVQKKAVVYDHDEDEHYDTISAFIKSVRGSDPNAAVYWLAKMLYAGEDPRFIAPGPDAGRFSHAGRGIYRHAGGAHSAGPGRHLSGLRSQKQRRLPGGEHRAGGCQAGSHPAGSEIPAKRPET